MPKLLPHPALAQAHHHGVAVDALVDGDEVGLPRVRAVLEDHRQRDPLDVAEALGVAVGGGRAVGHQLRQAAELDAHHRGLHVGHAVVVARHVEGRHGQRGGALAAHGGRDAVGVQLAGQRPSARRRRRRARRPRRP